MEMGPEKSPEEWMGVPTEIGDGVEEKIKTASIVITVNRLKLEKTIEKTFFQLREKKRKTRNQSDEVLDSDSS